MPLLGGILALRYHTEEEIMAGRDHPSAVIIVHILGTRQLLVCRDISEIPRYPKCRTCLDLSHYRLLRTTIPDEIIVIQMVD